MQNGLLLVGFAKGPPEMRRSTSGRTRPETRTLQDPPFGRITTETLLFFSAPAITSAPTLRGTTKQSKTLNRKQESRNGTIASLRNVN